MLKSIMLKKKLFGLSYWQGFLLACGLAFVVRVIPELLSFPFLIGWDTIYYAYRIEEGVLFGFWDNIFSSWMIYAILMVVSDLSHLTPFILLKIVAPLLFSGAAAGVCYRFRPAFCQLFTQFSHGRVLGPHLDPIRFRSRAFCTCRCRRTAD